MRTLILLASLAMVASTMQAASQVASIKIGSIGQAQLLAAPPVSEASGQLQAAFSVQGKSGQVTTWSEGFDNGTDGWTLTPDADGNVTWSLKKSTGEGRDFSAIDSADVQSLYVEGPYQIFKRAIATAQSGEIEVPPNGVLHAWVGFSQNFSDECSLTLNVSDDNFATSTQLWSSLNETGPAQWRWHELALDLSAWAGKSVKLELVYGPGSADTFKTGGYMGDFYIDGLSVTGVQPVDGVSVGTGEPVRYVDVSSGTPTAWQWTFEGGTPSTSTEQSPEVVYTADGTYGVTLTVTDATGATSTATKANFVTVTGTAPTAHIMPPATFRYWDTKLPFVAPLLPVQYSDASTGYPTQWNWTFANSTPAESHEPNPMVAHDFLHQQQVTLEVANSHGSSSDVAQVSVEYAGYATNVLPTDAPASYDLEGDGTFPGSNRMDISEYGERFSRPSRPVLVYGAAVFFTAAKASALMDQIADVGVHLCASEQGLPGRKLDSSWWRVFELETGNAAGQLTPTIFEFTRPQVVDSEFFITVDGIPQSNDSCNVAFATARLRNHGNTAYMKSRGKWRPLTGYFSSDASETSFYIAPLIAHSVITPLPVGTREITVGEKAATVKQAIFSYLGYRVASIDEPWCRVANAPNGLTLDTLQIQFDALPAGIDSRKATIALTDSLDTITLQVVQSRQSGVGTVNSSLGTQVNATVDGATLWVLVPAGTTRIEVFAADGRCLAQVGLKAGEPHREAIDAAAWPAGVYVAHVTTENGPRAVKFVKR